MPPELWPVRLRIVILHSRTEDFQILTNHFTQRANLRSRSRQISGAHITRTVASPATLSATLVKLASVATNEPSSIGATPFLADWKT